MDKLENKWFGCFIVKIFETILNCSGDGRDMLILWQINVLSFVKSFEKII